MDRAGLIGAGVQRPGVDWQRKCSDEASRTDHVGADGRVEGFRYGSVAGNEIAVLALAGRLLVFFRGALAIVSFWAVVLPLAVMVVVLYLCKLFPLAGRRRPDVPPT